MNALEALRERRSVRSFLERPIDKSALETIIDCARFAPTANNSQPWEFVVVTDPATRAKIADITDYGKFIRRSPACVALFCRNTKYYLEDGSAATQNILLAAWALGIGSCWVAGDKKPYAETIRQMLKVPEGYKLVSLIALGYFQGKPSISKRPLNDVLHWEEFGRRE